MIKGPESTKLHVMLIYLSGKHANNFSVLEKITVRLLLYCFVGHEPVLYNLELLF